MSRGESIYRLLLEFCSLLTMVNTVTTRKPNSFCGVQGFEPCVCTTHDFNLTTPRPADLL